MEDDGDMDDEGVEYTVTSTIFEYEVYPGTALSVTAT